MDRITEMPKNLPDGKRIIKERQNRGYTQDHLSQISGVSVRSIQRIESGKPASLSNLQALAAAFKCEVKDILLDDKSSTSNNKNFKNKSTPEKKPIKIHFLSRLKTGKDVFSITAGSHLFRFDGADTDQKTEADAMAGFLQNIQETSEIWGDIESGHRIQYTFECNEWVKDIENHGFSVFGLRRNVFVNTAMDRTQKIPMIEATLIIIRSNDPKIIKNTDGTESLPASFESPPDPNGDV